MGKSQRVRVPRPRPNGLPKRPWTAFFFYINERRRILKEEQPLLTNKEVIEAMSTEWNGFSEDDKEIYYKKAKEDKLRYEREKKEYDERMKKEREAKYGEYPLNKTPDDK